MQKTVIPLRPIYTTPSSGLRKSGKLVNHFPEDLPHKMILTSSKVHSHSTELFSRNAAGGMPLLMLKIILLVVTQDYWIYSKRCGARLRFGPTHTSTL